MTDFTHPLVCPFIFVYSDVLYSAKVEGVHKEFQKAVRAGVCRFIPMTGHLMLVSTDEASQKKARMIQEMHFRNLSQKVLLVKRTEEAARQLESTKLHTTAGG